MLLFLRKTLVPPRGPLSKFLEEPLNQPSSARVYREEASPLVHIRGETPGAELKGPKNSLR